MKEEEVKSENSVSEESLETEKERFGAIEAAKESTGTVGEDDRPSEGVEEESAGKKSKTPVIVLGVVCVLAVIGIVIYLVLDGMGKFDSNEKVTKIGDYKNFTYEEFSAAVTDEEVMQSYEYMVSYYVDYLGYKYYEKNDSRDGTLVEDGDTINIDYTGYIDGEAFENGSDTGVDLTIGSNSFIDGFESSLIGKTVGETVDINVTFPEEYPKNPDMAGVEAVFTVTINYVGNNVPITTENAYSILFGFETLEELKAYIRTTMESDNASSEESYYEEKKEEYIRQVIENSEFADLTEEATAYADKIMEMVESAATANNLTVENYVSQLYGYSSLEEYTTALQENCLIEKKKDCLVNAIAEIENITMSDQDYQNLALEIVTAYSSTTDPDVDEYQKGYDEQYGDGAFRQYMFDVYVIDILFEKYAVMTPAVATGATAE